MTLRIVERPSPNFNDRPEGARVSILVLHYTGMPDAESAMQILTDGARQPRVSAHYTLDEDGTFHAHVPEARRAWHAGVSHWNGHDDVNSRSIGIEIVNPGHEYGYRDFPDAQIGALIVMAKAICARWGIAARHVIGHSDVAPGRKIDPGEKFPWAALAAEGLGVMPHADGPPVADDVFAIAGALRAIGYGVPPAVTTPLSTVISAFQRHFAPHRLDGVADRETLQALGGVLAALHGA